MKKIILLSGLLSLSFLSVANASIYNTTAGSFGDNRGTFNAQGVGGNKIGDSFQVRAFENIPITRNYHIFDIPTLTTNEVVSSIKLSIPHPNNSYDSPDSSETVGLFDIDPANFAALRDPTGQSSSTIDALFNDLGTGISYGSFTSSSADTGTTQTIIFNDSSTDSLLDILTTFGQAGGGDFGIGGTVISADIGSGIQRVLRGTGGSFTQLTNLEITTTVVPAPAAVWLFGSALLGLAGSAKRRHS